MDITTIKKKDPLPPPPIPGVTYEKNNPIKHYDISEKGYFELVDDAMDYLVGKPITIQNIDRMRRSIYNMSIDNGFGCSKPEDFFPKFKAGDRIELEGLLLDFWASWQQGYFKHIFYRYNIANGTIYRVED